MTPRTKRKIAYIYKLVNPETTLPFYVGATINKKNRYSAHCSSPKTLIGKKLKSKGIKPLFIIIEECDIKIAAKRESFWICEFCTTIENSHKGSNYSKKSGRNPIKDKKKGIRIYVQQSKIDAMGGEDKANQKLLAFVKREVNKYKI